MIKIKFIKDGGKESSYKKGDIVKCSLKDAKEIVESGFAVYAKKLNKDIQKDNEIPIIKTSSFYKNNEIIIEQIYDPDKKISELIVMTKDKKIEVVPYYDYKGYRYKPMNDEELHLGIVSLPSTIGYYDNVLDLIKEVKEFIYNYLDIDERYLQFATWYVLLTWVYDRFNTLNYLRALGDTGCGKSRFLDTIGGLCYKNIRGSGAVTVASLKRITKKWGGTLIIDEGDFKESDEKAELIKFFNLGYEKNRPLMNCDKNDPSKLEFFIPYCPKLISTRQTFKDKALESRCLTKVMQETDREDIPVILFDKFYQKQKDLMNKLLKFRFDTLFKIDASKEIEFKTDIKIEPRLRQSTYSFVNLFSENKEAMEEFKGFIEKTQKDLIEERSESFEGMIINAIYELMESYLQNNKDLESFYISSKDIIEKMNDLFGFEANIRVVGRRLKSLGFETKQKKIDGKNKRYLIITKDILRYFQRYVSSGTSNIEVALVSLVASHKSICDINDTYDRGLVIECERVDDTNDTNDTNDTSKNRGFSSGNHP